MTFGRTPHESTGFGPSPSAASFDAPYADGRADGFGDRGPAADGFGRQPAPLAAGQQPDAGVDGSRPVTHAELAEHDERVRLVGRYEKYLALRFQDVYEAIRATCERLEVHRPKKSSLLSEMVNMAASAAIAGAAGVVAEIVAKRLSSHVTTGVDWFKHAHQRFGNDALKEHLKSSFRVGIAIPYDMTEVELAVAFRSAQYKKLRAAQKQYIDNFDKQTGLELAQMPVPVLRSMVEAAGEPGQDGEIVQATAQQIAVEWANLVARMKHGAGVWDPWAGEHGSEGALPTEDAAPAPTYAAGGAPDKEHPSAGNVDPDSESVREATDHDQRTMNPTLHGILEINLWGTGVAPREDGPAYARRHTRFELFTHHGHGMRLAGVSDHVKHLIRSFAAIRDLKMNKVVALYDNENLNPPKPVGRFLITADGYIRRTSMDGGEAEMLDAAEFAQALSPSLLR